MKTPKIYICGDVHAQWSHLNTFINKKKPDVILQCGDWGWWPHFDGSYSTMEHGKRWYQNGIKNHQNDKTTQIFWAPGNHENWEDLNNNFGYNMSEVHPDIWYCPFGSVLELPDGRNVLFVGGAESTDKEQRTVGVSWWFDEIITNADFRELPNPDEVKIDIVISHTVPQLFMKEFHNKFDPWVRDQRWNDPSCKALDEVLRMFKPDLWFSGHFHEFMYGRYDNTLWFGLADIPYDRWYVDLSKLPEGRKK